MFGASLIYGFMLPLVLTVAAVIALDSIQHSRRSWRYYGLALLMAVGFQLLYIGIGLAVGPHLSIR